jgi:hypothetical protein
MRGKERGGQAELEYNVRLEFEFFPIKTLISISTLLTSSSFIKARTHPDLQNPIKESIKMSSPCTISPRNNPDMQKSKKKKILHEEYLLTMHPRLLIFLFSQSGK